MIYNDCYSFFKVFHQPICKGDLGTLLKYPEGGIDPVQNNPSQMEGCS